MTPRASFAGFVSRRCPSGPSRWRGFYRPNVSQLYPQTNRFTVGVHPRCWLTAAEFSESAQTAWRSSRPSWSQSSATKTLSFGWCARTTRRSSLPSGCQPGPKKSSNATFKQRLQERYVPRSLNADRCTAAVSLAFRSVLIILPSASRSTLITRPETWSGATLRRPPRCASMMPRGSSTAWWRGTRTHASSGPTSIRLYLTPRRNQWRCKETRCLRHHLCRCCRRGADPCAVLPECCAFARPGTTGGDPLMPQVPKTFPGAAEDML